ncbi:MAG: DUF4157 domain-containing protein [Leptothrix sp. (in: Bacteria)]|jgi:hypothetical protein|nr:DUF4157 domain-containing protein [Leptothrix sp. (in: b-proteobacteria)]MBP7518841.1 DUF4157 domain-containing protein [Leptothrix sp. (in: b-proteobacteria)]
MPAPALAPGLAVSRPEDAAEREASRVARRIVQMPEPRPAADGPAPITVPAHAHQSPRSIGLPLPGVHRAAALPAGTASPAVARFAGSVGVRSPAAGGAALAGAAASAGAAAPRAVAGSGGAALPEALRQDMEQRFGADFSAVRIHTGEASAQTSRQLQAAAFTVGGNIHFGPDRWQPGSAAGRELLAHELAHTVQQGAAHQPARLQRSADPTVSVQQRVPAQVQRLGISDALDWFADKASWIPGFRLFTLLIGFNPINLRRVDRTAANLLRALIELLPGGALITQALDNHGIVDRVAHWAMGQLQALADIGSSVRQGIDDFLDGLSWTDIFDLGGLWNRARRIVTDPIDRILAFGRNLIGGIVDLVKDAILRPLGALAARTRAWPLLCAVLGRDPVTGDAVPRSPAAILGGFMTLIGQEEVWQNIQRGNAIGRAWAWFQGAMADLLGFVREIPGTFLALLRSLELMDIVLLPRAFAKVGAAFASFAGRFISWALGTVMNLLEIIFSVVAPGVMVYLRRAAGAFRTIVRNPVGFIRNLVRAGLTGLRQFAANFLGHLRGSLIGWLTGAMGGAGLYIPQAFTLPEILRFVLSVLGLTWANLRGKLVRAVGETAVAAMETGFDIVRTLVTQGPAAAWERIQESLSNLREMVMEQIMSFVSTRIVQAAITRLVTSLNPAGAFIQAILAIYNTVMFFVERLRQIAQVAASVIDSLAAIASGAIGAAANRVEQTLAGLLTLVISFLARIVGLGRVSDAVTNIINRIRAPIDRALDRVVAWIVNAARRLGRFVAGAASNAAGAARGWLGLRQQFAGADGQSHSIYFAPAGDNELTVASRPRPVLEFLAAVLAADPTQRPQVDQARERVRAIGQIKRNTGLTDAVKTRQIGTEASALAALLRGMSDNAEFFARTPARRELPAGFDVRTDLYINGSGFGSAAANLRSGGKARISAALIGLKTTTSNAAWQQLARDGQIFESPSEGSYRSPAQIRAMSDSAIRSLVNRQDYDVDHTQPLARHWVNTGYNSADAVRHRVAGSPSNLKLMLAFYNRQAGAGGNYYADKFWVGPDFSSTYNASLPRARKIKGLDFVVR